MQQAPIHLNTRQDYHFLRANYPPDVWVPRWRELLATLYIWQDAGKLAATRKGKTDQNNRVVEVDQDGVIVRIQQERKEDPNARLFRLGFTVLEIETAIQEGEAEGAGNE